MINSLRMPDDELQGKYIAILHLSWVSCIKLTKLTSIFLWQSSYVVHEQTTTSLLYWLKVLEYEFHLKKNTYTYKSTCFTFYKILTGEICTIHQPQGRKSQSIQKILLSTL